MKCLKIPLNGLTWLTTTERGWKFLEMAGNKFFTNLIIPGKGWKFLEIDEKMERLNMAENGYKWFALCGMRDFFCDLLYPCNAYFFWVFSYLKKKNLDKQFVLLYEIILHFSCMWDFQPCLELS